MSEKIKKAVNKAFETIEKDLSKEKKFKCKTVKIFLMEKHMTK